MQGRILSQLEMLETRESIRILYAVESGSRAWGFASADSDYDVRFLYVRSAHDYLSIRPPRDVVELPLEDDLDINGWDLFKALTLFRSSNPPLIEWLFSPIVYLEHGELAANLRRLAQEHFSPRRMAYHYLSMAKRNYKEYIEGKSEVRLKKYLYVMRPLICVAWLEQNASPPPTRMEDALAGIALANDVRANLSEIVQRKQQSDELGVNPPFEALNRYIAETIERVTEAIPALPDPTIESLTLDALAWKELGL